MNVELLFKILVKLALIENPNLHDGSDKNQAYLDGLRQMTQLYVEVGSEGRVSSPDVDAVLLATIGYEESRHRPKVEDGDCHLSLKGPPVCEAFGPMQVSRATPFVLRTIEPDEWKGVTVKDLREPRRNVEAAYRLLRYWSDQCSGSLDNLMGNWSAGKCLKGPIYMGAHRCALARAIGEAAGVEVGACTRAAPPRSRKLAQRLKKNLAEESSKPVAAPVAPTGDKKP